MSIRKLKLEGFRCFRRETAIALPDGRSVCIVAANGRGKTSIVDALEFWSRGDVADCHRDGVGLGALVHLDASEAVVELTVDGAGVAARKLTGATPGPLEAGTGPLAEGFEPKALPILRHRTMARFVDKTAGDKRAELLDALGLEQLAEFRRGARSLARELSTREATATDRVRIAEGEVAAIAGETSVESYLGSLSKQASVAPPLDTVDDLVDWEPGEAEQDEGRKRSVVAELDEACEQLRNASLARWGSAVADRALAEGRALRTLLDVGSAALRTSEDDRCPLCLVEQDRGELLHRVEKRAADLAQATATFEEAERELDDYFAVLQRVGRAVGEAIELLGEREEAAERLTRFRDELREEYRAASEARRTSSAHEVSVEIVTQKELKAVADAAGPAPEEEANARVSLLTLRARLKVQRTAEDALARVRAHAAAGDAARELTEIRVEAEISRALETLNESLAEFYGSLVGASVYSKLRLEYTDQRAGGVEFAFEWDDRHTVRPPQRIMSESELNALGLALFLARLHAQPPGWKVMVLDDVVTSFDNVHRTRLVRLLEDKFSEWQILLLTHDEQLARTAGAEAPGWLRRKAVNWLPTEGPTFDDARNVARLRARLDQGESAGELGGLARLAIEEALERPVQKLGLPIRHDPSNSYTAEEYRRTLIRGLKAGEFQRAEDPVLRRLSTDGSVTNRACHFKDQDDGVTEEDLRVLIDDIEALENLFVCTKCEKKLWEIRDFTSRHCQCACGELSCA